jgi:hypothetical protein
MDGVAVRSEGDGVHYRMRSFVSPSERILDRAWRLYACPSGRSRPAGRAVVSRTIGRRWIDELPFNNGVACIVCGEGAYTGDGLVLALRCWLPPVGTTRSLHVGGLSTSTGVGTVSDVVS